MKGEHLAWALFVGLGVIYLAGFALGLGGRASWHLLLVLVAIAGLYAVFSRRGSR